MGHTQSVPGPDPEVLSAMTMPPEWAPHERTWMAFPPANDTFGPSGSHSLARAREAWSEVARRISRYEPVVMAVTPEDVDDARGLLGEDIAVVPMDLDDAWIRDSGLTFVHDSEGDVHGVDWVFNGWGAQEWAAWVADAAVGVKMAAWAGVPRRASALVNEGGGIHVDGRGTVLMTETVQLDPGRNPGFSAAAVDDEVHRQLGTRHTIWLPRGLTKDYAEFGTRGHVDIVACFTESGSLLLHRQDDPAHPDYAVTLQLRELLEAAVDAEGNPLRIVDVSAPKGIRDDEGSFNDWSYINHYVANDAVILCSFGDPRDDRAAQILADAYPGRTVEQVDAREIFRFGGGIHCITQQQPATRGNTGRTRSTRT